MSRLATQKSSIVTLCARRPPAGDREACFVERVTRSTALDRIHAGLKKCVSDLRICRAAYRNRTDDLRITRVFSCVARGFKARPSFMFAACCWRQSLAIDGGSGTSRGHGSVMRRPGSRWDGAVARPSLFRPAVVLSRHTTYERTAVPPLAGASPLAAGVAVTVAVSPTRHPRPQATALTCRLRPRKNGSWVTMREQHGDTSLYGGTGEILT
jgi:hypothetical protein